MKINENIKPQLGYVHWDSDDEDSRTVSPLKCICLKVIYSNKLLGKVPKRFRKASQGFDDNNDLSVNIDSIIDRLNIDGRVNESGNDDSPKLGTSRYSSPWNNSEDYNSDSIINDAFKGFSSRSNDHSNDSQSLVTNTVKDLIINNNAKEIVVRDGSKDKQLNDQSLVTNTIKDLIKSNNTEEIVRKEGKKDKELNDLDACNDDLTKNNQNHDEKSIDNMVTIENSSVCNELSVNVVNNVKPNTDTNNLNEVKITTGTKHVSIKNDLNINKIDSSIHHLNDNHEQNIIKNVKLTKEITDVSETNENLHSSESYNSVVTLEVSNENSFLYNKEDKAVSSNTFCSEECTTRNDTMMRCTNNDISDSETLNHDDDCGIREEENINEINCAQNINDNVCKKLDINEHVDTVYENKGLVNRNITEVNSSDTSGLISSNFNTNCESLTNTSVKDNVGYSDMCLSDNASFNKGVDDNSIDDRADIFKMINEQIAIINQKQANNTQETNVSDFTMTNNDEFRSYNLNSDLSKSTDCNDKVHHENDKVRYQNDSLYYNNDMKSAVASVDNAGLPVNDFNNQISMVDNEIYDNDKVDNDNEGLNNQLKIRDSELDGMDLDSISDDDFNFE